MHDQSIARLRRQIAAVLMLKQALLWLAAWAFVWGTLVIIWRVAASGSGAELGWGLIAAPLVAVVASLWALRRLPTRESLRALVDGASHCGGLLMTDAETPIGPWRQALPEPAPLSVRWRGSRAATTFSASILYLGVALLFPQSLVSLAAEAPLDISQEARQLAAQLDVLKEEAALEPQKAEEYQRELKRLKDDAKGTSPAKTLEALDRLRDLAEKAAKEAAESAIKKTEKLAGAEGLAEGIRKNEGALDPKVEKEALGTLAALVQAAMAETGVLDKRFDPELSKELEKAKLNPEDLKKLAAALKAGKRDLSKMLDKLHAARLIDADLLKKLADAGKFDGEALAALLKPCKCREATGKCDCLETVKKGGRPEPPKCKCCEESGACKCDKLCSVKDMVAQCLG